MSKISGGATIFGRFVLSGGFNTIATYALYLILLGFFSYQISYAVAYVSGVILAYYLNSKLVFKSNQGLRSVLLFPLVYVIQYIWNGFVLWVAVEKFGVNSEFALLVVILLFVPVSYFLSRKIFSANNYK
ncbi:MULTISPECIES: GtrA family protein [Pseudomonas]|uniref:GtrA family protein n=1 Tax=Pseudomonas siliginis TaxID=2842346 RepID=A0ABY5C8G7_9PSED|nr:MULTISPECIES: GtrA family protein [Pseudomonas]UST72968.1 GtrA family protein [Pseudomonas siliginis]UST83555.1 GtrA family protein [Pseudomonas siliginis]